MWMNVVYNKDHIHNLMNGSKMLIFAYNSDRRVRGKWFRQNRRNRKGIRRRVYLKSSTFLLFEK